MTRTYWMSFADEHALLGVCVIDVDAAEAEDIKAEVDAKFPVHAEGAEWLAAATRKSWLYGCNPGGQILFAEIPGDVPVPRNRLLVGEELAKWGTKTTHICTH